MAFDLETIPQGRLLEGVDGRWRQGATAAPLDYGQMWRDFEKVWDEVYAAQSVGSFVPQVVKDLAGDDGGYIEHFVSTDDLAGEFPYYYDHLLDTCSAPLLETGCAPALDPRTAHICAAIFVGHDGTDYRGDVLTLNDYGIAEVYHAEPDAVEEAERKLVATAIDRLSLLGGRIRHPLVTFNGKGFDVVRMLRPRAVALGVEPKKVDWGALSYPFRYDKHADLRLASTGDDRYGRGDLVSWARFVGVEAYSRGADVWKMAAAGDWDSVRSYGQEESDTLVGVWEKWKGWV